MKRSKHGIAFRVGPIRVNLVFRYQGDSDDLLDEMLWKRERTLGLWWKTMKLVGSTKGLPKWLWSDPHSPCVMFGLKLIWAKCWIKLAWNPLILKIDEEL